MRARAPRVPAVEVRQGFTTVLSWTDTTGSPWPIEEVLVDSQFLPGERGEDGGGGHLVYVAPKRRFLSGNLVVKLRDLAEPMVVLLQDSGGAESDFRVEMRLGRPGPGVDAAALMRPASFHAGDEQLAALLSGVAPAGAVRVEIEGGGAGDRAWRQGEDLLLVSRHVVLSPGPWAAERGFGRKVGLQASLDAAGVGLAGRAGAAAVDPECRCAVVGWCGRGRRMMWARLVLGGVLGLAMLSSSWAIEGVTPEGKFNPDDGVGTQKFGESIEQRDAQRREEKPPIKASLTWMSCRAQRSGSGGTRWNRPK